MGFDIGGGHGLEIYFGVLGTTTPGDTQIYHDLNFSKSNTLLLYHGVQVQISASRSAPTISQRHHFPVSVSSLEQLQAASTRNDDKFDGSL